MILSIDPTLCKGCRICEVFCSLHHESRVDPELSRIHVWRQDDEGRFLPVACVPCAQKACLAACPEPGALSIDEHGAVVINEALCTGCSRCVRACQLHAISFQRLPGRGKFGKAVALKCDQCGGNPVCVRHCPSGALAFVDSEDGQAIHDRQLASLKQIQQEFLSGESSRVRSSV